MPAYMRKLTIAIDGPSGAGKERSRARSRRRWDIATRRQRGDVPRRRVEGPQGRHSRSTTKPRSKRWPSGRASSSRTRGSRSTKPTLTREIRTCRAIDRAAASVARLPRVRSVPVRQQRESGAGGGIVMEGRDIGTVGVPRRRREDLTRMPRPKNDARAAARSDPAHAGLPAAVSDVARMLTERDRSDSTRTASPLYAALDAVVVDTTDKGVSKTLWRRCWRWCGARLRTFEVRSQTKQVGS